MGRLLHRFGSAGSAVGAFKGGGLGIAAPGDGNVYTTDTGNCRLQVFTVSSALNQATPAPIEYMGTCGSASNQMSGPRSIAVKGSTAWIADVGNNRIARWDVPNRTSLGPVRPTCGGVALCSPTGVAWDPAGTWLYVADTGNRRVVRMKGTGASARSSRTARTRPRGSRVRTTSPSTATVAST